jgi:transcriptional regulator with PAS, ATPase and Fis domain
VSATDVERPHLSLTDFHGIVTASPQMRGLFELLRRIARTDASVLIRGETGTGKELVARAIHELSPRGKGPVQSVNCATLTPELAASELFGHLKGSFTGAIRDRRGLFAAADGGTVFLDEVAELTLDIQARLLRVLQERTFVPVGGTDPVRTDVRLLSATNKSLRDEVEGGRFREDLMYRIRVVPLFLPPLVERDHDVAALLWHFIDAMNHAPHASRKIERIAGDAHEAILHYHWPGNVRELRNVVEYAFAVGEGPRLTLDQLPPELRGERPPRGPTAGRSPEEQERQRIHDALEQCGGRKSEAAELLGMSRSTLWRKMRELHIG